MDSGEPGGVHLVVIAFLSVAFWLVGSFWLATESVMFFTGREFETDFAGAAEVLRDVVFRDADIDEAWGYDVPNGYVMWPAYFVAGVFVGAIWLVAAQMLRGRMWGAERRKVLGVDNEAQFAGRRDLVALETKNDAVGRLVLGEFNGKLLATENGDEGAKKVKRAVTNARTYDRGAVAIIGPSRCGKTTALIASILQWDGPAILVSVKDDLFAALPERRRRGEVAVFDPTGRMATAYRQRIDNKDPVPEGWDFRLLGGWDPLRGAETYEGASKAAYKLVEARPTTGDKRDDFWAGLAGQLLTGYFYVAANAELSMADVVRWVKTSDGPNEQGDGIVKGLIETLRLRSPKKLADLERAAYELEAVWGGADVTRSSVFTTCQQLVRGWSTEAAALSAESNHIDLEWIMDGSGGDRTVFVSAPPSEMNRLSALFGGFLNDIFEQAYDYNLLHPEGMRKPLLIVIDEASKIPMERLPEYASTVAGLGIQLVTVWQNRFQIHSVYHDTKADELLSSHITKIIFPGLEGGDVEWVSKFLGERFDMSRRETEDLIHSRKGSVQTDEQVRALAPVHAIRQMSKKSILLFHGALKPGVLRAVRFHEIPRLRRMAKWSVDRPWWAPWRLVDDPDMGIPRFGVVAEDLLAAGASRGPVSTLDLLRKGTL